MPVVRTSVPIACLVVALALTPLFGPGVLATDEVVVRAGDTLTAISKRHGVTIRTLVIANGLADPDRIYVGQRLVIPTNGAPPVPPAAPAAPAVPVAAPGTSAATVHTVARGENLWSIARFYGVSLSELVSLNGISNPARIHAGLRLTIPGSAPANAPAPAPAPAAPAAPPPPTTGMSPWMANAVAQRDGVRQIIVEEATAAGVPVALALAVAWQESGWRNDVVSSAGAIGVMQLMPATAVWVGDAMLGRPVNTRDTRDNVTAGVRLLAHYLDRYDGNVHLVLAAYYQGQTAADRHGVYPVTRPYIASIEALVRLFGG